MSIHYYAGPLEKPETAHQVDAECDEGTPHLKVLCDNMILVQARKSNNNLFAWLYVGTAGFGTGTWDQVTKEGDGYPTRRIAQSWECGIIFRAQFGPDVEGDGVPEYDVCLDEFDINRIWSLFSSDLEPIFTPERKERAEAAIRQIDEFFRETYAREHE
jgi:hypothetical protein